MLCKYLYSIRRMNKSILIPLCLLFMVGTSCKKGESLNNSKILFDFDWRFALNDHPNAEKPGFNDSEWRLLDIPHDWSIEGDIDSKNPTGMAGGYFSAGVGWYRKTFEAPITWKDKHVSIYFEGVYMNSEVFVNGISLGIQPYGYTSFRYDLSPYLNFGNQNVISVKVDNSEQINSRWYSGSGIYRHVWLEVNNLVHIAPWGAAITTPDVSSNKATVQIKTVVKNDTDQPQSIVLQTQLLSGNSEKVGNDQGKLEVSANSEKEITQTIVVSNPLLWTPETPNLYLVQVQILKNEGVIDQIEIPVGIRSIKFTAENGFQLNGKTVNMNGGCIHHDNGCLGAAAFDRAEERKVELLKEAGFNAVRTSHNPPSEAFLRACDRLGLLVIDESFDGWKVNKNPNDYAKFFDQWWKRDLDAMVLRDRNHPSVIMWSIGNEIIERKDPEAVETAKMLVAEIKSIDTSRPVTSAMTTWDNEWEIFDPLMAAHDVSGYNYQLFRAQSDHERVPSRVILHTESYPKNAFTNWKWVQDNDYIIGDFVWTAMDYLGESSIGRWYYPGEQLGEHWENDFFPWHGAYCGDIDLTGFRKPISHYRNLLWNDTEKLYMSVREPNPETGDIKLTLWAVWPEWESWTWPQYEGKNMEVEVYSKYPKVRLYLNNNLISEQSTTEDEEYKTIFTVPYAPGTLKAIGLENNQEKESTILQTAGNASNIKLSADRNDIMADGQDLSYVSVEITDKDGIIQPNASNLLQFKIDGPGVIIGVDNGDLKNRDSYKVKARKAWHGRALVVIKSAKSPGDIKLTVTSPELAETTITIKTIQNNEHHE